MKFMENFFKHIVDHTVCFFFPVRDYFLYVLDVCSESVRYAIVPPIAIAAISPHAAPVVRTFFLFISSFSANPIAVQGLLSFLFLYFFLFEVSLFEVLPACSRISPILFKATTHPSTRNNPFFPNRPIRKPSFGI